MRSVRRVGVTLIELTVAMFIAVFILAAVVDMFFQQRRNYERPRAQMSIQEDVMHLARTLRQDLLETNVQTIRSFPNSKNPNEPPGLSLESPRAAGGPITLQFGVVQWSRYVYYTLEANPGSNPTTGRLVRVEGPLTDQPAAPAPLGGVPVASALTPSAAVSDAAASTTVVQRTVATNVSLTVAPNGAASAANGAPTTVESFLQSGFEVFFVDSTGAQRPFEDSPPSGAPVDGARGLPVQVHIQLQDSGLATGKPTFISYPIFVVPRN